MLFLHMIIFLSYVLSLSLSHYNWFLIKSFMTEVPIPALQINGLISL